MRPGRQLKSKRCTIAIHAVINDTQDTRSLHLFRALLRQCTYLPDSAARQYLHKHIVSRFRAYRPHRDLLSQSKGKRSIADTRQRRETLLKTARRGLLTLQRANDGHPRHLGKILAMTYGRIGKRRHQLLKPLTIPDLPVDEVESNKTWAGMSDPASQDVPHPSRQFSALVRAQAMRKLSFFSRPNRPALEPQIPEKNAWGRPMPIKRVRNFKRRWYGETLDRVMPPLPEEEWERLRKLASGEIRWDGPVSRRGYVQDKGVNREIVRGTITNGTGFLSHPHSITARSMRRLWAKIFEQCPLMLSDESKKSGWLVRWGNIQGSKDLVLRARHPQNAAMFEGVDQNGNLLKAA